MKFPLSNLTAARGMAGGEGSQGKGNAGLSVTHVLLILLSAPSEWHPKIISTLAKIRHHGGFYGTAVSGN